MLITKTAKVKLNSKNMDYYHELGFDGEKGTFVEIPVKMLTKGSEYLVEYECDVCHNVFQISMYDYRNKSNKNGFDCCKACKGVASKMTNLERYGVENPMQLDSVKDKVKTTMFERYGEDNAMKVKSIQDKAKHTNMEKYGCENCLQNPLILEKQRKTMIDKYGVEHPTQNKEIFDKVKRTFIKKYGVDNPMKNKESVDKLSDSLLNRTPEQLAIAWEKRKKTNRERYGVDTALCIESYRHKDVINFSTDGSTKYSKGQKYVCDILGGILNFKDGLFFLDMYFKDDMIYIEWDGGGHWLSVYQGLVSLEEFNNRQERRRILLLSSGKREIRFISRKDKIPPDDVILKMKEYGFHLIKDKGYEQVIFDIDKSVVKYGFVEEEFKYF